SNINVRLSAQIKSENGRHSNGKPVISRIFPVRLSVTKSLVPDTVNASYLRLRVVTRLSFFMPVSSKASPILNSGISSPTVNRVTPIWRCDLGNGGFDDWGRV